ncbi:hypothetical protein ACOAD5_02915 [Xylella fastidiosa]|uniref:hypothetical protein n=1 Tax=Xylella fastidiosa TaxID=2371 RepID=UPI003DA5B9EB
MVIGGARDGAGRKQGGKAAVVGCFGVSLGCIGGGFLCLIFEVYITIFWLCKGGQGVGGVWGVGGGAVGVVAVAVFEALLQVRWQVFA